MRGAAPRTPLPGCRALLSEMAEINLAMTRTGSGSVLFQLHQHVLVGEIVEIAQLVSLSGWQEERFALLVVAVAHLAFDRGELDLAAGHRHNQIGQVMPVHALDPARSDREAPYPDRLVLEDDLVADRAELDVGSRVTCHDDPPLASALTAGRRGLSCSQRPLYQKDKPNVNDGRVAQLCPAPRP